MFPSRRPRMEPSAPQTIDGRHMPAKLHFVTAPQGAPIIFWPRLSYAVPDSDEVKRHKMSLRWGNETVARTKTKETEKHKPAARNGNGANLGFEAQLFLAADKLRKNLEPSDYKHVALGLICLKHISNAFEAKRAALLAEDATAAEDPDEYLAENVFWVPKEARWSHLQANAKPHTIGKMIDDAMAEIEKVNPSLKGVLPKDYNRPALDKVMLGELIDLVSGIGMGEPGDKAKDILGRVYEYFLGGFAGSEGKRGGEFYTPRSVVHVLVAMLEPYKVRVYDPCCGSGGMFVLSEKFVESHGGRIAG